MGSGLTWGKAHQLGMDDWCLVKGPDPPGCYFFHLLLAADLLLGSSFALLWLCGQLL